MRKFIYAFGTAIFLAMFIFTAATSLTNPFYGLSEDVLAQSSTNGCNLCRIEKNGDIIFSCKPNEGTTCSKKRLGYTLSCTEAKECEN